MIELPLAYEETALLIPVIPDNLLKSFRDASKAALRTSLDFGDTYLNFDNLKLICKYLNRNTVVSLLSTRRKDQLDELLGTVCRDEAFKKEHSFDCGSTAEAIITFIKGYPKIALEVNLDQIFLALVSLTNAVGIAEKLDYTMRLILG